jgi:hypothetical protein
MRPLGWKYESHRHALAARGIATSRRAYLAKGNTESGALKSFLATPIGTDPVTGRPIYPKKSDFGIPYAERRPSYSSQQIQQAIEQARQQGPAQQQFNETELPPAYMTRPVQETVPIVDAQITEVEKEEAPQELLLPSDDKIVDEEEISLARKNAFDRSIELGGDKIPVPVTPGVPMYTGGMQ